MGNVAVDWKLLRMYEKMSSKGYTLERRDDNILLMKKKTDGRNMVCMLTDHGEKLEMSREEYDRLRGVFVRG